MESTTLIDRVILYEKMVVCISKAVFSAMDYLNSKIGATYNDDYTLQISLFRSP